MPKPKRREPHAAETSVHALRSTVRFAGLFLLVLLAYANSFRAGFVFDNRALILEDARLRSVDGSNLSLILNRPYWWPVAQTPLYRPLTTFSYLVNYSVFGNADRPFGYHVVNLALHLANVWLVFVLARRLMSGFWPAFFATSVWAVHPLGTEAVTNVVGRADLLAALGVLTAFYAHLRAREAVPEDSWRWTMVSALGIALGVFSKENAAAGVGVIVLYDLLWRQDARIATLSRRWVAVGIPVLLFLIQRTIVLHQFPAAAIPYVDNPILGAGFWRGRLTAVAVIGRYLALLAWPAHLSPDYSFSQIPLASGTVAEIIEWTAVAVLAGAAVLLIKRNRQLSFSLLCAFVTLLPVANLLFVTGTVMAERLMYLPSMFLIVAACGALYAIARWVGTPMAAPAVVSALAVLAAGRSFVRNADWHDDLTLWTAAATNAPLSFKTHDSLADALYDADPTHANLDRIIAEKEKSLAILRSVPDPAAISRPYRVAAGYYLELADWLRDRHADDREIAAAYRRAADLGQRYLQLTAERPVSAKEQSEGELLVSTAAARLGDHETAITMARRATSAAPLNPLSYRATAAALIEAQRLDDAALELMTGFILTGNQELRTALLDLYRSGLDANRCATLTAANGIVLNVRCEIVRRHLCAAAERAMRIQQAAGHPELAAQVTSFTADARCGPAR